MHRDEENFRPDDSMGHLLAGMQAVAWNESLTSDKAILRLANPTDVQLRTVAGRFGLDELHLRDIRNTQHPPVFTRLESGALHLILRFPVSVGHGDVEVSSVSIIADSRACALIWPVRRHYLFSNEDLAAESVEGCVCRIIHLLVDFLLKRSNQLRDELDEFEDECLADVGKADLGKLLEMRKELSMLARNARNNAQVIDKLAMDEAYRGSVILADAHEHMLRAASIAESRAEHALNVMQAIQSLLSQRLNEVMRFLAVITVVLTPMGIIAGIFGMNFTKMDVLTYPAGFALSLWGMAILGAALAIFFKIRKWW